MFYVSIMTLQKLSAYITLMGVADMEYVKNGPVLVFCSYASNLKRSQSNFNKLDFVTSNILLNNAK